MAKLSALWLDVRGDAGAAINECLGSKDLACKLAVASSCVAGLRHIQGQMTGKEAAAPAATSLAGIPGFTSPLVPLGPAVPTAPELASASDFEDDAAASDIQDGVEKPEAALVNESQATPHQNGV